MNLKQYKFPTKTFHDVNSNKINKNSYVNHQKLLNYNNNVVKLIRNFGRKRNTTNIKADVDC